MHISSSELVFDPEKFGTRASSSQVFPRSIGEQPDRAWKGRTIASDLECSIVEL